MSTVGRTIFWTGVPGLYKELGKQATKQAPPWPMVLVSRFMTWVSALASLNVGCDWKSKFLPFPPKVALGQTFFFFITAVNKARTVVRPSSLRLTSLCSCLWIFECHVASP